MIIKYTHTNPHKQSAFSSGLFLFSKYGVNQLAGEFARASSCTPKLQGEKNDPKSKQQIKKIVLANSGGLDTSVIVPWLKENYGCEVICFCADVGQGDEDVSGLEQKTLKIGASQFVIHDMKEEFASEYLFPMLKMGSVYEHKYLLGTSVARPLLAKHLVEVAHQFGADTVARGATGKGNDQARFELTVMALDPRLKIIEEPNHWDRIALGCKGSAWANVIVKREQTHTASREETAAEVVVDIW